MGSLPVRSSVVTSELISISGSLVGVGVETETGRELELLRSFTCTDLAEGMV